jgi:hypothetical protein
MMRPISLAIAFGIGGLVGTLLATTWFAESDARPAILHPIWTEVQWPFPIDQWGQGKAFQCKAADCGTKVNVYLRAKIGFCNCTTGVVDDTELDRLSDFELIGRPVAARQVGQPIAAARMKGRSRAYAISGPGRHPKSAIFIAFNDRCDAIVATVVLNDDKPAEIEPHVIEFLNGDTVVRWAEATLGL